jgi:hypothetical protein
MGEFHTGIDHCLDALVATLYEGFKRLIDSRCVSDALREDNSILERHSSAHAHMSRCCMCRITNQDSAVEVRNQAMDLNSASQESY